ncbi:hypothetical protein ACFWZW_06325 [Microbacterium enclense]|uniref:hypothetical protein n=1 Tax=Microbacterium enclense TaxID=993073 RepID=UPI0036D9BBD9
MGLFASRPEEPTEWAGLPGEPLQPRSVADLLPDEGDRDATAPDALGLLGGATVSVGIPVTLDDVEPEDEPDEDSGE